MCHFKPFTWQRFTTQEIAKNIFLQCKSAPDEATMQKKILPDLRPKNSKTCPAFQLHILLLCCAHSIHFNYLKFDLKFKWNRVNVFSKRPAVIAKQRVFRCLDFLNHKLITLIL